MYTKSDKLANFDWYPCVIAVGKTVKMTVRPTGGRKIFEPGKEYNLDVCALDGGEPRWYPATGDFRRRRVVCNQNGGFEFDIAFDSEQEYFLRFLDDDNKRLEQFPVFAVDADLAGRYPFMGDLHMHTCMSDGRQLPEVVAANYRSYGYDFTVISDHRRYYPSLRAINCYKEVPTEMNIVCGEEVHLPEVDGMKADMHIVNFGGSYSVNALTEGEHINEVGTDAAARSLDGDCPPVMSKAEFDEKMRRLASELDAPEYIDKLPYAIAKWAFGEIRKGGGLAIFPHPNWRNNVNHVPEKFTDFLFEQHDFDAFEVLGGERDFNHNGFQTSRYYMEWAKGNRYPVVGSTDSHSSLPSNDGAFICETIVFSPENERTALIKSIKNFYSVAVDTISKEYRLVGEPRFVRYGCFLLDNFFPRHDELSYEEGRLMLRYATGTDDEKADAAATLKVINGRMKKQREKYFSF